MTKTQELAAFLKAHPGQWFDARALEFAGRQAWRMRVSDCRTQLGMTIENRQRTVKQRDLFSTKTKTWTVSEYRYVPTSLGVATAEAACNVSDGSL